MARDPKDDFRSRRAERTSRRSDGGADWSSVNGQVVVDAVAWVGAMGGALRLGYTRDGGAYAIGIYLDGESTTEYVRPSEDIDQWLKDLAEDMRISFGQKGT